jgi:hypothetical protein
LESYGTGGYRKNVGSTHIQQIHTNSIIKHENSKMCTEKCAPYHRQQQLRWCGRHWPPPAPHNQRPPTMWSTAFWYSNV